MNQKKMNKLGRKPITDWITPRKLIAAYSVHKSAGKAARALGVSKPTMLRYLRQYGLEINPRGGPWRKGMKLTRKSYSKFAQWLRENPDVELPKSPSKIAEITGLSSDTIRSYMKRLRNRIRERIKALPELREAEISAHDTLGTRWYFTQIVQYSLKFNKHTLEVTMCARMRDSEGHRVDTVFLFDSVEEIEELIKNE